MLALRYDGWLIKITR